LRYVCQRPEVIEMHGGVLNHLGMGSAKVLPHLLHGVVSE